MAGLEYLKIYNSTGTVTMYRSAVRSFLSFLYEREFDNGDLEKAAVSYFKEGRDHQKDMDAFIASIKDAAPKTRKFKIAAIKTFYIENGVEFPTLYWKRLRDRVKGSRALTLDRPPTNQELKQLVTFMPLHGKALFLMLASSGMRIGEALQLKLEDVDLNSDPAKVSIRGAYTKSGNSRIAFISTETKEMLNQWLTTRTEYIGSAAARAWEFGKDLDDTRIFPFTITNSYIAWKNALKKMGLDGKDAATKRMLIHPHVLRKFFRSRLGVAIPVDVVEALMGHEGYLTEVYRKYSVDELASFYKKGEYTLTVLGNGHEVTKLKAEIDEKSKILNEGMATLALKNADLENRLTALISEKKASEDVNKKFLEGLNERIARLEKLIGQLSKTQ